MNTKRSLSKKYFKQRVNEDKPVDGTLCFFLFPNLLG